MGDFKLLGKEISGPFTIPAGIVATEVSTLEKIANEVPEVGILTTKSIGINPREGCREPILAQYIHFSFFNAVCLANPGKDRYARMLSKAKIPPDKFLMASIFGSGELEFRAVARKLFKYADGFELNISCPHTAGYGQTIGQNPDHVRRVTQAVATLGKPVFVKISPNLDVKKTVQAALNGGAWGITAINTFGPETCLHNGYPVLSNKVGGVSGRAIFKLGLKCVREVRSLTETTPIIGCGGIMTAKDVWHYKAAGANFFGVGSALAGMTTDEVKAYFNELWFDFRHDTNGALKYLKENLSMRYRKFKVKKNERLADDLFLLRLDHDLNADPGQFVFAWLPEKGEKPFSVLDDAPLTLLVQKRGYFTNELSKLEKSDVLYIRGPYGSSPKIDGNALLVGGGTGIAALYLFAKKNKNTVALLGAKDKNHFPYLEKFRDACEDVYLTTEDGGIGYKGLVTDNLEAIIKNANPVYLVNCGPEPMVRTAIDYELAYANPENIYSSINSLTMCGVGLCGRDATRKGYRSCVDGTFLKPDQI